MEAAPGAIPPQAATAPLPCGSPSRKATGDGCTGARSRTAAEISGIRNLASPDGYGRTFSAGLSVGATYIYESKGVSACISSDDDGNYALQGTTSHVTATGIGASVGLTLTYTNATNIEDLEGTSTSIGGTICSLGGIAIDYISFVPASNPNITCWGICVTISGGAGVEFHENYNYTTAISDTWNAWLALRDLF